jgi:predicted transposase/invertase (TIGR01784 family)
MSEYVNPLTDTGFKLIFGSPENDLLLIDFLNCLFKGERKIVSIEYMDKEQISGVEGWRNIIYDVYCKTDTGEYVIVEMQNQRRENFIDRTVYYASQAICRQGQKGRLWNYDIKDVYCIAFMNYTDELFGDKLCSCAKLTIDGSGKQLTTLLRLYYIQLPLAKEDDADCVTSIESWTYILRNMNALNLPRYSDNEVFKYLKDVTDVASLSPKERARYERDLKNLRDAYSLDMTYEHGLKKAKEEGIAKGEALKAMNIARNLIKEKLPVDIIARATGLSIEEINAISLN